MTLSRPPRNSTLRAPARPSSIRACCSFSRFSACGGSWPEAVAELVADRPQLARLAGGDDAAVDVDLRRLEGDEGGRQVGVDRDVEADRLRRLLALALRLRRPRPPPRRSSGSRARSRPRRRGRTARRRAGCRRRGCRGRASRSGSRSRARCGRRGSRAAPPPPRSAPRPRGRAGRRRRARESARPGRGSGRPGESPSWSARSTISVLAVGMSRPDSMIVVVTRQSASPRRKPSIVSSSVCSSICPWASRKRAPGTSAAQALGRLRQRVDPVVEDEGLAAALDLALDRLADQVLVVGADVGADRAPALGRGLDHRDVAQAGEAHLQGARDRRRRERQHVDFQLQLAQQLLLLDPEALLLVDDDQAQVLGADVAREQPVGADQDVDLARLEVRRAPLSPRPAGAGGRRPRPGRAGRRGARGRCRSAAGRGSSSAPASSPACRRRRP